MTRIRPAGQGHQSAIDEQFHWWRLTFVNQVAVSAKFTVV